MEQPSRCGICGDIFKSGDNEAVCTDQSGHFIEGHEECASRHPEFKVYAYGKFIEDVPPKMMVCAYN